MARQIIDSVDKAIMDAEFLRKKERGENVDKFSDYWNKIWPKK